MTLSRLSLTAILPLELAVKQRKELLKRYPWQHWTKGLDDNSVTDQRRFYNRSTVDLFRPLQAGRWRLTMDQALGGPLSLAANSKVKLQSLTLVQLDQRLLVYLNISAEEVAADEVYELQRQIVSFFPKNQHIQLPHWQYGKQSKPLQEWLEQLFELRFCHDNQYVDDWFGHELPYCLQLENANGKRLNDQLINLAAGAQPSKPGYRLADGEFKRLSDSCFSVWEDWQALQAYHRLIFISEKGSAALNMNLQQLQYYVDLFALGLVQRLALDGFQQQFTGATKKEFKQLTTKINRFRQTFNITQVCSYPLAQRLYDYFVQRLQLRELEGRVFKEIEYHHQEQQREQAGRFNIMLFSISVVAALILPLEALSTLLSLPEAQRTGDFWWSVGAGSLAILLIMVAPVIVRRKL
ncbi:hypothetical protein [Idiomarina sp.]|uniref:hypothetical protein n=1 Tax=Idiomarina sp. TaxID=1874361 RepID=UPI0025BB55EA|nr:hypothetical protein [Idiomarina sp.]